MDSEVFRCFGTKQGQELYAKYHDEEWGKPVFDDRLLFEMLILEGAHAGLSWEIILKKREGYKKAFYNFDIKKVASMTDEKLNLLLLDTSIVRNKLKIYSARRNAIVFLKVQEEFGSFSKYIWSFVDGKQIKNSWTSFSQVPSKTPKSDQISKDLKKRGMNFVGSTIIYAYMQAIGMVNDHLANCSFGRL